jgi:hypothetical protein
MKKLSLIFISAFLLLQCGTFPNRFDRIEATVIRPIGFVYDPYAEGAPGDTIHLHAYFGGDPIVKTSWQLSYNDLKSLSGGQDTVVNYAPLTTFGLTSNLPDSLDFSFVIPDTAFFLTQAITQQALATLKKSLPAAMATMTQQGFAAFLRALGATNINDPAAVALFLQQWGPTLGIATSSSSAMDSLVSVAGKVLSVFSIQGVLLATVQDSVGHQLQIRGQFTIRYNRHFQNTPFDTLIPVNHNPTMNWVGIYKIKSNSASGFDPGDSILGGRYTPQYLYNSLSPVAIADTVLIDTGYTYFFAADSGINTVVSNGVTVTDTTRDKFFFVDAQTGRDTFQLETWFYDWELQDENLDSVTQPLDSLLLFSPGSSGGGGGEESYMKVLPSLDT